jgi:DNA-directed RNA polymerase subunit N (RpoN/RPB10)
VFVVTIKCKDCGKVFRLSKEDVEWHKDRNLDIPVRCHDCGRKLTRSFLSSLGCDVPPLEEWM